MKVLLLGEDNIMDFILPSKIEGNIWITNEDKSGILKNIINIEARNDKWEIISNSDYYVLENSKKADYLEISEYNTYILKNSFSDDILYLYCCPIYENNIDFFEVSSKLITGITISNNSNSQIVYDCPLILNTLIELKMVDEKIILSTNANVYVNGVKTKGTVLEFGDTIFLYGLIIVVLKDKDSYILGINNPNNKMKTFLKKIENNENLNNNSYDESDEEKEMSLYTENEYFYRKPRFLYSMQECDLKIESPPSKTEKDEIPLILTLGPMLTMSATSFVSIYSITQDIKNEKQTLEESMTSLIITGVMLISLLVWPLITNLFQKNLKKKKEKIRQKKYNEYIEEIKIKVEEEKKNQKNVLVKNYANLYECERIINEKDDRLWERRIEDYDFLKVSLGIGDIPMNIKISYTEEKFSIEEDSLKTKAKELSTSNMLLTDVPVVYDFCENYISAIIGDKKISSILVKNIVLQLVTFHSYDDLKIVLFTSKEKEHNWEELKILPHIFNNDKTFRYFASNNDEYKEINYQLEQIINERKTNEDSQNKTKYHQKYLIITDSFNFIRNYECIKNIIESDEYIGFSLLMLNDKISNLPEQCQSFIEVNRDKCKCFKNIINDGVIEFNINFNNIKFYKSFKKISNIPIQISDAKEGLIPKKVGFLEMYSIGKIEQLNCKKRWQENVPLLNMGAEVGIGKNGEKIVLDLHEKYHGPHGLVAGMTGSGKSEFIITYILSMAINYHPHEVQFILIDYKGGGLAGAFENSTLGYKLPHLVGVITNLDKSEINRSLASIESELKRRQDLFNKARDKSGESTIDIYKYQKLYRNGVVDEPVAHLIIIADEFAELKTQQPEFMEQLISTARIGRSLGVHLILATQKPNGVVDSQIWSNTRFRVCLRVQETGDSSEVIKCPDAAYLTQTGRFYLQVGYNEIFVLGQSAWAGGKYLPSENIKKTIDTSVNFINNIGYITKNIETRKKDNTVEIVDQGEELINIVKYLCTSATEENIKCKPLWLSKIPEFILVDNLINKYNYKKEQFILNPVIGEYDIPSKQQQNLLTIPFTKEGNVLLYGMAGSGKENFITTMIYSSMITYTPAEINYYIIDFGSEMLKYFDNSNIVGDILYPSDNEKISNLFKIINDSILQRKQLFSEYGGDYLSYCERSNNPLPNIVIIINNYEAFIETYPEYDDILLVLTRDCIKYGIYFLITIISSNGIRFRIKQNFGQTFVLQQNSDDDYSQILGNINKSYPSKNFGRGLIKKEDIHEFQTAYVCDKENISEKIRDINNSIRLKQGAVLRKVPILPEIVVYDDLAIDSNIITTIGVNKHDLKLTQYDFSLDPINIVTGNDFSLFETFINPLLYQFIQNNLIFNVVINCSDIQIDDEIIPKVMYSNSNFDEIYNILLNFLNNSVTLYEQNHRDKSIFNNRKKVNCVIISPSSFKLKLSDINQLNYDKLFTTGNDLGIINYTFIDTENKLKENDYEDWYKNSHNSSNFIWIGSGISDQYSFTITSKIKELNEEIPYNFCYVVKKGKPELVKFVEKIHN